MLTVLKTIVSYWLLISAPKFSSSWFSANLPNIVHILKPWSNKTYLTINNSHAIRYSLKQILFHKWHIYFNNESNLNYLSYFIFKALIDRGLFDQNSLDRNCVLSVDQNFYNQLTKIFDTFHLIEFLKPNLTWPNLT